jgi:hypothetical protein
MSPTTLRASLAAVLLSTTFQAATPALAQSGAAKTREAPRAPTGDGDAARAEELCSRGEELSKGGDTRGALEASGEAARLYARVYAGARTPTPPSAPDAPARFRAEMAARLRRAPRCVELYTRLGGPEGATDFARAQLEALRAHAVGLTESDAPGVVYFAPETYVPALVVSKPQPRFPPGQRERDRVVSVTVLMRVVLSADGEARDAFLLKGPPGAFAESCAEAAKRVKFRPAVRDGRQVSQFVTLEYNFRTY